MESLAGEVALVFGAGGVGGPAALGLAMAGVGRIVLCDASLVSSTDLPVLPLLAEAEVGTPRAAALARALARLHPTLAVEPVAGPVQAADALALARVAQVVVDGSDRFETMFLASDAACAAGVPLVHAGLLHHTAQLLSVLPGSTGCLRCLFEGPPPSSAAGTAEQGRLEPGVLGPLAGLVGSLVAAEAVRLLQGEAGAYAGQLVSYESRSGWTRTVALPPRPGCPACGSAQRARQAAGDGRPGHPAGSAAGALEGSRA